MAGTNTRQAFSREGRVNGIATVNNSTAEQTLLAAVAGATRDLHELVLSNSGAAATVATIRSTTGGPARLVVAVPVGATVIVDFDTASALSGQPNANWTVQCSVATVSLEVLGCFQDY